MKTEDRLKAKQECFCQAYTAHWNATRAAKEAGYSEKTASEQGYQLLQIPSVRDRIAQLSEHSLREIGVVRERVLAELAMIALADVTQAHDDVGGLKPFKEMPEGVRRALLSLEVTEVFDGGSGKSAIGLLKKIRFVDKVRALELLGKHLKLFTEKHELSGPDGKPIDTRDVSTLTDEQLDLKLAAQLAAYREKLPQVGGEN